MRIVTLEEHFSIADIVSRIPRDVVERWGWPSDMPAQFRHDAELADLDELRIADMDEAGISFQVLSSTGPGADLLTGDDAITFARDYNDALATAVARRPDRFAGFAHLPVSEVAAATEELERAVGQLGFRGALIDGVSGGRFLDHPDFAPLLSRFEQLDVPLYLHPSLAPRAVQEAYFSDLPDHMGFVLGMAGWGWHAETALHVLRLYLSGAFERHPRLKLVIGHMGEGLPAMLGRCENVLTPMTSKYLSRTVRETLLDQVWITTSGVFDIPAFMPALLTFGADRIMFSVDYPYAPNAVARRFLDSLPVSLADRAKIAHATADTLLRLPVSEHVA